MTTSRISRLLVLRLPWQICRTDEKKPMHLRPIPCLVVSLSRAIRSQIQWTMKPVTATLPSTTTDQIRRLINAHLRRALTLMPRSLHMRTTRKMHTLRAHRTCTTLRPRFRDGQSPTTSSPPVVSPSSPEIQRRWPSQNAVSEIDGHSEFGRGAAAASRDERGYRY